MRLARPYTSDLDLNSADHISNINFLNRVSYSSIKFWWDTKTSSHYLSWTDSISGEDTVVQAATPTNGRQLLAYRSIKENVVLLYKTSTLGPCFPINTSELERFGLFRLMFDSRCFVREFYRWKLERLVQSYPGLHSAREWFLKIPNPWISALNLMGSSWEGEIGSTFGTRGDLDFVVKASMFAGSQTWCCERWWY